MRRVRGKSGSSRALLLCLLGTLLALTPAGAQEPGTIQTVAGSGTDPAGTSDYGYEGDGGPATGAKMRYPYDAVIAPDGTFYISDNWNQVIRKVDPQGIITTYAGTPGQGGFAGDGGPATQALFYYPRGLALDAQGNLFVADDHNNRIRRIDALTGIITTVVGSGAKGAEPNGDGGPAAQASLEYPFDVKVAPDGTLYVADTYKHRVRKVDPQTKIITTVAGIGSYGFSGDGGPATRAELNQPFGIALGPEGLLYIADTANSRIRRVNADGTITTVAGGGLRPSQGFPLSELPEGWPGELVGDYGPATEATLANPYAVDFDTQGRMLISDTYHVRIRRVESDGTIATVAGNGKRFFTGDGGPATQAALHGPFGIATDAQGSLFIAQTGSHRIRKVQGPFGPAPRFLPQAP
jgi:sugar lactone lactonase YvrE